MSETERLDQLEQIVAELVEVVQELVRRSERPGMQELVGHVLRRAGGKRE